jgi:hypothetical protein
MARECSFLLPGGRKCRCAATRNQPLCRHHAPKPNPGPPPIPKSERYSDLIRWRRLSRNLPWMPAAQIPREIYTILQCLIDRGPESTGRISDLTAGRFLRALLTRLGDVPFPDPDFESTTLPPAAPAASPAQLNAMLAALAPLGTLPSPHPAAARVHQSHAPVHQ